jgi:RNA polymerase sigma-70 factor, ECF subfamily
MPAEFNAPRPDLSPSSTGASGESSDGEKEQLSTARRVSTSVSTAAIDRSVLMSAGGAPPAQGLQPALLDAAYTDAEVMLRVKAGDQSAFDYLVQKYRRPLVNFMYRMARNSAVAEDLAQEVFLRVYRSRESYEASAKFTTWLYRIATNLAVSLDEPDEDTGSTADVADSAITAEEAMVRRERLSAIRSKVEALPERQRLAVIMHKYQQMDYKRIAEVLKLSESATKSLLFRAYEALREQLKEFL